MKQQKLSKLENNYYYGISRYFWHFVIGVAILGIIGGIGMYGWSLIPAFKREVVKSPKPIKQNYPKQKEVSFKKLLNSLPVEIKKERVEKEVEKIEEVPINYQYEKSSSVDSVAINRFLAELEVTKSLIQVVGNEGFWKGKGEYKFNTERDRKMYKKTKNPKLRNWVATKKGFKDEYITYTKKQKIKEYKNKTALLASINELIANIKPENRKNLITRQLLHTRVANLGLDKTRNIYHNIGLSLTKFSKEKQLDAYKKLFRFAVENKNDGIPLIHYYTSIADSISIDQRLPFFKIIQREYYNYYNNNLSSLKEATNQFMPYLKKIKPEVRTLSLEVFYKLYRENNKERYKKIKEIEKKHLNDINNWESNFQIMLAKAEQKYLSKKQKKNEVRDFSYKSMLYGFVGILIVSLILLVLSMIRNVNRLSEAMLENNQLFQKNLQQSKKEEKPNE